MSLLTPEQFGAMQKANLDTFFGLSSKAVEGIEKLAELNLEALRSALAETQANVLKVLSTQEPREWIAQQSTLAAAIPERVQSYNRQVFDIASGVQAEFARLAQAQCEASNKRIRMLVEDVAKSAPTGSESAIAAWKSAITATNTLLETVQKSYQQAAQVAESNFAAGTSAAPKVTRRAAEHAAASAKS